jgi:hypothetical protein
MGRLVAKLGFLKCGCQILECKPGDHSIMVQPHVCNIDDEKVENWSVTFNTITGKMTAS